MKLFVKIREDGTLGQRTNRRTELNEKEIEFETFPEGEWYFDPVTETAVRIPDRPELFGFSWSADLWDWVDTRPENEKAKSLALDKTSAKNKVEAKCATIRESFITISPGQEMIYMEKEKEARALMNAYDGVTGEASLNMDDYPFINNEVGLTAPTAYEVAQVILNLAHLCRVWGTRVEKIRLSTRRLIEEAAQGKDVKKVKDDFYAGSEELNRDISMNTISR